LRNTVNFGPITEKLSQKTQVIAVGEIATRLKRRIPFLELKESYAISLADYSALYYKDCHAKLDSTGKPGVLGVPSSELVKAIESVSLCLEGLNVQLRGYQEFGIKYLIHQQLTVLGDEMGLGKTIHALGAIVHLQNTTNATHFLVVAPAGITPNWEKEIRARTHLTPWMLYGADKQRFLRQWQKMGGIALVSFSSLHTIANEANLTIHMVIGDEAHYVKNPSARRSKAFRSIAQSVEHVSLMSGTPMEIRPEEFIEVMKALGTDAKTGLSPATKPQQQLSAGPRKFAEAVSPVYLRRNQTDVLHELPEKIECAEWVDMSFEERSIYDQSVSSSHAMQIRQATTTAIRKSAKLNRIKKLLAEYHDTKSKVVIFSYFHSCLNAVCEELPNHYRIDGSVTAVQRQAIVDQFCNKTGHAVLVSRIEAGGVGLNIQAANVVIIMEPQVKPTIEWQAIARVYRMGQARRVVVHRMLAIDTIDQRLTARLQQRTQQFNAFAKPSMIKDQSVSAIDCSTASDAVNKQQSSAEIVTPSQIIAMEKLALDERNAAHLLRTG